ncbi:GNAT family N-acetyltransferase [Acetobacter okinawensis]|uniref:GNAT family N-acetyltransferase n=2 Tax=Acetobacter okinawensis TaxID=1076594 RepID=UPI00209DE4F0|nr:GNAT family N-acetyltransferase [Acetobacter okinawensis]MCP1213495.1 GNAT family N-acetyltransferase [Acetobacter okinawensis]
MCRSLSPLPMAHPPLPEHPPRAAEACIIRLATLADCAHLPALEQDAARAFASIPELAWLAGGPVTSPAAHQRCVATQTCWVGVETTGQVRGFLSATPYGHTLHIEEMSVAQAAQGHGLGRRLLHSACQAAQERGMRHVTLTTFRAVPWNAPFYASVGFCVVPPNALDARLGHILEQEVAHGFDATARCAMRLDLQPTVQCVPE